MEFDTCRQFDLPQRGTSRRWTIIGASNGAANVTFCSIFTSDKGRVILWNKFHMDVAPYQPEKWEAFPMKEKERRVGLHFRGIFIG